MTNPVLLPIRTQDFEPVMRLVADLAAAHARGQDLGSRVPHIQAACERLLELDRTLNSAITDLDCSLSKIGVNSKNLTAPLMQISNRIRGLSCETLSLIDKGADYY